jgi:hypothetical protein
MPVALPRELLEQILSDPQLDPLTLGRCCQLSKDWVNFIRPRLYRHLSFNLIDSDPDENDGSTCQQITRRTYGLIMRLRGSRRLRALVKEVTFEDLSFNDYIDQVNGHAPDEYVPSSGVDNSIQDFVRTVLDVCYNVERLALPRFDREERAVDCLNSLYEWADLEEGGPPTALYLPLFEPASAVLVLRASSFIDTLVVVGEEDSEDGVSTPHFRAPFFDFGNLSLSTLHVTAAGFNYVVNAAEVIHALITSSRSSLRSLAFPLHPDFQIDFSEYPHLQHLDLEVSRNRHFSDNNTAEHALSHLPLSLSSLSLYTINGFESSHIARLAASLPLSLTQLRLDQAAPDELLSVLSHLPQRSRLRLLRCQAYRRSDLVNYTPVEDACRALGIELRLTWWN